MQQTPPSQARGQREGQGESRRKRSPLVLGLGAAVIASAVTLLVVQSQNSSTAPAAVHTASRHCPLVPRRLLISTEHGGGTVRFRASGYLSPPFTLTNRPQVVQFPLPRPESDPVTEQIAVEGEATDLVLGSEATDLHQVFDVSGIYNLNLIWRPLNGC